MQVLARGVHRAHAGRHLPRQLQPVVVDVGQHHGAGARVPRHRRRHDADGSCARDQHVLAQQIELLGRVHGVAEGVEDRADLVGHVVRQLDHVKGRGHDVFGEGALAVHADAARLGIEVEVPGARRLRVQVDDVAFRRDTLTDLQPPVDFRTNGDDLARKLVPGNHRRGHVLLGPLVPVPDVDVGATDGGPVHLDQHVLRPRLRHRRVDEFEPLHGSCLGQRLHGLRHWITPSSLPAVVKAATV